MEKVVYFQFDSSLNDFLPSHKKEQEFAYTFTGNPSVKDAIEAIGVPHVEIGEIIGEGGKRINLDDKVENSINVHVYPVSLQNYPSNITFIADVHLGKLAKALRLLGFDTVFDQSSTDQTIISTAIEEHRIVLSRSINLLKNKKVQYGYWLRDQLVENQIVEVLKYFGLSSKIRPFVRCLVCNGKIDEVQKEKISTSLPADTVKYFNEFYHCTNCSRVYWKGSHYDKMMLFIERIMKKVDS